MKNNSNVSVFYGRARRIEFAEKIAYITVGVIAVFLVCLLVFKQETEVDYNVNFANLRNYLEGRGYQCEMIHLSGGQCYMYGEYNNYNFIRFEDGFEYFIRSDSYLLNIRHTLKDEDRITFKTTSEAFVGYKNESYVCSFEKNVVNKIGECKNEEGIVLDLDSYIWVIEKAIIDLNSILDSSGYHKADLIDNYTWIKKQ